VQKTQLARIIIWLSSHALNVAPQSMLVQQQTPIYQPMPLFFGSDHHN
jgi:hypothetical protein